MRRYDPARRRGAEEAALRDLDRIRAPLFRELERLLSDPEYLRGEEPHACCLREKNQMRISPLEARAIARAFRTDPALRARLPAVLERLRKELDRLEDNGERQNFDCPLLEGTRCLVHDRAKPIGCTAWHPGREFSREGWKAFAARDELNDSVYGPDWKLRVIPLWLSRVLAPEPGKTAPKGRDSRLRGGASRRGKGPLPGSRGARRSGSSPSRRRPG
jgi:hypothetical protein